MTASVCMDGIIFCLQSHGGISVYFRQLLGHMQSSGYSVETILYTGSSELSQGLANASLRSARLLERYRDCQCQPETDLFHSSYYRLPVDDKPRVVTTVHDFTYEKLVTGPRRSIHCWQKHRAIRAADAVICVSENTRQDLLYYLPDTDEEKVHVVYNGVAEEFYPADGVTTHPNAVLFVGARGGYKNYESAIRAIANFDELELICVGGGPFTPAEYRLTRRLLGKRFSKYEHVTVGQLNKLYNSSLCLLYPSSYEGFGMPVLEAMRAGCAVVSVAGSAISEIAGDAAVLVSQPSAAALSQALVQVRDSERRSEHVAKGLLQARRFSWEQTFADMQAIYEGLLGD